MDIFSTQVLAKVVERLRTPPSFLLDTFFRMFRLPTRKRFSLM